MSQITYGLFIFHRDFRTTDNTSLYYLSKEVDKIIPIFIFDPYQIDNSSLSTSQNSIDFMVYSLEDLNHNQLNNKMTYFYNSPSKILEDIFKLNSNITHLAFNMDYTPYAQKRDTQLITIAKKYNIKLIIQEDYPITNNILNTFNKKNEPYKKFTPFYNQAKHIKPNTPTQTLKSTIFTKLTPNSKLKHIIKSPITQFTSISKSDLYITPGRTHILNLLKTNAFKETIKSYAKTRENPSHDTTLLSPHIKFGTISIRELYTYLKTHNASPQLIRQLYWRDFYAAILLTSPEIITNKSTPNFYPKFNKLKWHSSPVLYKKWTSASTGFPIIDAGIRQLIQTGFMHNRVRMLTASFLIKDLHISWQKGEEFFSKYLIDIDLAVNNGNWQNIAGTGASAQPWFRVMNPWIQSKKYDPDAQYIKHFIPELKDIPAKDIHTWYTSYKLYPQIKYPKPIIDHEKEKKITLKMYKSV